MKYLIAKWCLEHDHALTFIMGLILFVLALTLTFVVCAITEYNNCDGSLSFAGYDFTEIIDFGLFKAPAITPTFECTANT